MAKACDDSQEDLVVERFDAAGERWLKKYVGGGLHFENWLAQFREVYGESNVEVEEVAATSLSCYSEGKEKLYRIWVKEK